MLTEQQVQSKLIKKYEKQGYYVLKLIKTNKNGIPDLLCLRTDKPPLFIEVKKPKGGVISKLQEFRVKELRGFGFDAFVSNGTDEIL